MKKKECTACPIYKEGARTNCMVGDGRAGAKFFFLGEAPGRVEDKIGEPFVGRAGQLLKDTLRRAKIKLDDCYFTNVARCRPLNNRTPTPTEAKTCINKWLIDEIKRIKPRVIILVGGTALKAMVPKGYLRGGITEHRGDLITDGAYGVVGFYPILHPAYVLRNDNFISTFQRDIRKLVELSKSGFKVSKKPRMDVVDLSLGKGRKARTRLIKVIGMLTHKPALAYDVETDGEHGKKVFCLSVSDGNKVYWIDARVKWWDEECVAALKVLLEKRKRELIAHYAQNDDQWMRDTFKIKPISTFDTAVAMYCLHQDRAESRGSGFGLKKLAHEFTDFGDYEYDLTTFLRRHRIVSKNGKQIVVPCLTKKEHTERDEVIVTRKLEKKLHMARVPKEILMPYSCADSEATFIVYKALNKQLRQDKRLYKLFRLLMMPGQVVLRRVGATGVLLDLRRLHKLRKNLKRDIEEREGRILGLATVRKYGRYKKRKVNAVRKKPLVDIPVLLSASSKDVPCILFEKSFYGLKPIKRSEKTGAPSCDKGVLEALLEKRSTGKNAKRFIKRMMTLRKLQKIYSTYAVGLGDQVSSDGRVRGRYSNISTETGRLSSFSPNMQNIPTKGEFRKCFIARPGYVFVEADYSQLELRIAGMLSKDKRFIKYFKKGVDMHKDTASLMFRVPMNKVTKDQRFKGKTGNFASIYGAGATLLVELFGVTYTEGERLINRFFKGHKEFAAFVRECHKFVRKNGYITTPFGRFRRLPDIRSGDKKKRYHALRQSINTPIQSSGSDILMMALIILVARSGKKNFYYVVCTVHDSIGFEVKKERLRQVVKKIKDTMEKVALPFKSYGIPIKVDIKVGRSWGELKEYKL